MQNSKRKKICSHFFRLYCFGLPIYSIQFASFCSFRPSSGKEDRILEHVGLRSGSGDAGYTESFLFLDTLSIGDLDLARLEQPDRPPRHTEHCNLSPEKTLFHFKRFFFHLVFIRMASASRSGKFWRALEWKQQEGTCWKEPDQMNPFQWVDLKLASQVLQLNRKIIQFRILSWSNLWNQLVSASIHPDPQTPTGLFLLVYG